MKRIETFMAMKKHRVVAVIRAPGSKIAVDLALALAEGGVRFVEVALTTPGAFEAVEDLARRARDRDLWVGAGTVLDAEAAARCIQCGADFVVSPHLCRRTVELCNRHRVAVVPGAATASEVVACLELGVEVVKIFPAGQLGPEWIKALRGPLPQANLMPTGGIDASNAAAFLGAGAFALGVGGELTREAVKRSNPRLAEAAARTLISAVERFGGNEP